MGYRSDLIAIIFLLLAVPLGSGLYTFYYAHGFSYLSDAPEACANCHVMREVYDGFAKTFALALSAALVRAAQAQKKEAASEPAA